MNPLVQVPIGRLMLGQRGSGVVFAELLDMFDAGGDASIDEITGVVAREGRVARRVDSASPGWTGAPGGDFGLDTDR